MTFPRLYYGLLMIKKEGNAEKQISREKQNSVEAEKQEKAEKQRSRGKEARKQRGNEAESGETQRSW